MESQKFFDDLDEGPNNAKKSIDTSKLEIVDNNQLEFEENEREVNNTMVI